MLDKNLESSDSVKKKVSKSFRSKGKPFRYGEKWIVLNVYLCAGMKLKIQTFLIAMFMKRLVIMPSFSRKVVVEIVSDSRRTGTIPSAVPVGNLSQSSNLH